MSTLQQIRDQTRILINETSDNSHISDSDLNTLINMGVRYAGTVLEWPRDIVSVQVQEGIGRYLVLSDTQYIRTAYFGDKTVGGDLQPLIIVTEETLKELKGNWLEESASNRGVPRRLVVLDKNSIYLDPPPNADESVSGKKVHLGYVFIPAQLTSDSQSPDLPLPSHDLIPFYAAHLFYLRREDPAFSNTMLANFNQKFEQIKPVVRRETEKTMEWQWGFDEGVNDDDIFSEIVP